MSALTMEERALIARALWEAHLSWSDIADYYADTDNEDADAKRVDHFRDKSKRARALHDKISAGRLLVEEGVYEHG